MHKTMHLTFLRTNLMRDYEYKRLGTLSLLAAIDLLTGIRVDSKNELVIRIYKYFEEVNAIPKKSMKSIIHMTLQTLKKRNG